MLHLAAKEGPPIVFFYDLVDFGELLHVIGHGEADSRAGADNWVNGSAEEVPWRRRAMIC